MHTVGRKNDAVTATADELHLYADGTSGNGVSDSVAVTCTVTLTLEG